MQICEATEADLVELVPIQMQVQALHLSEHPEIYRPINEEDCKASLRVFLTNPSSKIFLARMEDRVLGFGTLVISQLDSNPLRHADKVATVDQLAVLDAARRKGVAAALMNKIELESKKAGCSHIRLDVLEFNSGAISFYESIGFKTHRRRMSRKIAG